MKALKIDVLNQTITEVELNNAKELYGLIGNGCHTFCAPIEYNNGDTLFADDEALLHDELEGCFMFPKWKYPIVGNAVIANTDYDGYICDVQTNREDLLKDILWGDKSKAEQHRDNALSEPLFITSF
jgi:hypothetical protein